MLGNDVEFSLILLVCGIRGPLVSGRATNHFVLGAQLAPVEKKVSLYPWFRWRADDGPFVVYLDPLSPYQLKKTLSNLDPLR